MKEEIMKLEEARGQWALVTGASSGIGREFCFQLAETGMNLVLIARRENMLNTLSEELSDQYQIQTLALPIDLSHPEASADARSRIIAKGIRISLLINNAALGRWGQFEKTSPEIYQEMIFLNTATLISLCHHFLPDLTSFPNSAIINVSSPAAYQPVPYMAVYAATKAFVHSFSQALYGEWKKRGVLVQTLVPGPTETEFDTNAGAYKSAIKERGSPSEVVKASLAHLAKDNPVVATAKGTFKQRLFAALAPDKVVIREVGHMFEPPKDTPK